MNIQDKKDLETQLIRGSLSLIVLNLLDKTPMHGYGIITEIRKRTGKYLGPSTVYPLLRDLENNGFIEVEPIFNAITNKPIKNYSVTSEGRLLLQFGNQKFKQIYGESTGYDINDPMYIVRDWRWKNRAKKSLRYDFTIAPSEPQVIRN